MAAFSRRSLPTEYRKEQTDESQTQKTIRLCAGVLAVWAIMVDYRPFIHVFRFEGTGNAANDTLRRAFMSITLAHEIAHTAGMDDVYGADHDGEEGYQCMMEYHQSGEMVHFYNSVMSGQSSPFCSSCLSELATRIASNPYD